MIFLKCVLGKTKLGKHAVLDVHKYRPQTLTLKIIQKGRLATVH